MDMMKFVSIPYYALDRATNDSDFDVIAITLGVINIPTLITVKSTHCDSIANFSVIDNIIRLYMDNLNTFIHGGEVHIPYIKAKKDQDLIIRNARMFVLCHELVHALQYEQGRLPKYPQLFFSYEEYLNCSFEKEANLRALEYCKMYGD